MDHLVIHIVSQDHQLVSPFRTFGNYITVSTLLLLLPLLTLIPDLSLTSFSNISATPDNMTNSSGLSTEAIERLAQLEQIVNETQQQEEQSEKVRALLKQQQQEEEQQQELQARTERALLQQQQNYSSYRDPVLGIEFDYPSWWEITQDENLIRFDIVGDSDNTTLYNIANVQYFLPSLLKEMNTNDRFMRQMMDELRFPYGLGTQNININKTSTIGVEDIPAYRVESEDVLSNDIRFKNIRYFSIDNSTGVGYMISLNTNMTRLQEDTPLFEKMVESFKIYP